MAAFLRSLKLLVGVACCTRLYPAGEIQEEGVLLPADDVAVDLGRADTLPLGRREERLQCTCEAGES